MTMPAEARAAVLKALMEEIKKAYDLARSEADAQLRALYRTSNASRMDVVVPGAGRVAKITLSVPDAKIVLIDDLVVEWVKQHDPDQIREHVVRTPYVEPKFLRSLLDDLAVEDDGKGGDMIVLQSTGAVVNFARVASGGPGTATMTFEKGARDWIAAAWRDGTLQPQLMLEAPPPPRDETDDPIAVATDHALNVLEGEG